MTFGWASLSMVLLKSSRDKVQCLCSDVLEKLSNKTPMGNTLVMLEDPAFFLKGRWEHNFSCYHSQKTVLSEHCGQLLCTVHHTASLAECFVWAKAFSLFKLWAAVGITMWLFRGCWRFTYTCQKFSSEIWPLATGLALHLLCFPLSQSFLLVSHSHVPEFSPRHAPLPVFCLLAEGASWGGGKGISGIWGLSAYP